MRTSALVAGCLGMLVLAGCPDWKYGQTVHGVAFTRVKVDDRDAAIGEIAADTVVGGRPCKAGWLHLHPNGTPAAFAAAQPIAFARVTAPTGTWVFQDERGTMQICAFPHDLTVQGHQCRGSGGPKGVQTAFYPDGALREFFPPDDARVDGVLCRAGLIAGSIELHENGRLKSCQLGEDLVRDGERRRAGNRANFDPVGRVLP